MTTLLIILGVLYLGGPIVVWLTTKQAANPTLQSYGLQLQDPGFRFLSDAAARLQAMGFELIGYFGLVGQTSNVNMFLAYLIHRANGDAAIAAMAVSSAGTGAQLVDFATRFTDQSAITTGNSKTPSVYTRPRNKPVYRFPWVRDIARLYYFHQQLILRDKPGLAKDVPAPGAEIERLIDSIRQEHATQVAAKILRLDSTGSWYKPTLSGAFVMTWKLLFPMKQIIGFVKRSRARRLEEIFLSRQIAQPIHPRG